MTRHPTGKMFVRATPSLIAPRQALASHLLDEAEKAGANVSFQHKLKSIDFKNRVAQFEHQGSMVKVPYDLLIGADGCKSTVRTLLDRDSDVKDFSVKRIEEDSMEYQVVTIPRPFEQGKYPANSAHVWNSKAYNAITLAHPRADKEKGILFAIVFPQGKLDEWKKAHASGDSKGYNDALEAVMPDVDVSVRDEMVQQLAAGTPSNGGLCIWVSALGSADNGVALVGDAAHGMWPSLGQGCNCALESAAILCNVVKRLPNDSSSVAWSASVVREFNDKRFEDATAAVDLTYGGIGARFSRGRDNAPISYKLQVAGMLLLNKLTFGIVPMPTLFRLMKGEDVSYSTARRFKFYYEKAICLGALATCVIVPTIVVKYR